MELLDFENNVRQWAHQRGILTNGTPLSQLAKLVSEMGELADNIAKGKNVEDDIGDCMVVLTIIANLCKTDLDRCCTQAWNDIKDRKGYLNENGVFIKETQTFMEFDNE